MSRKRSFSESEKEKLKDKLCEECELSWSTQGYKKTSISYLTSRVGVSTGSFYILYRNKEELFIETLYRVQDRLKIVLNEILAENPNREGLVKALKWLYREYIDRSFLYDFTNPDFQSFLSKVNEGEIAKLKTNSLEYSELIIENANLTYKIEKDLVFDTIQALLYTVSASDTIVKEKIETFDLLLDAIIPHLFD